MAELVILMGIPGSGKSTWAKNHIKPEDVYIARDEIRFSLLQPGEDYFSHEKEVCRIMYEKINRALSENKTVFVDATHLNPASRNKLLRNIKHKVETKIVWIKTPLSVALERNEKRAGTRSYVPRDQICHMYKSMTKPTFEEGFDVIYVVEDGKPMQGFINERMEV